MWERKKIFTLVSRLRPLKINLHYFCSFLLLLILLSVQTSFAQKKSIQDSIKKVQREQRMVDSLNRAMKKLELKKANDSAVAARKQQRIQDSLANVAKRQQAKDSLELLKYKNKFGEEKLQEKLDERERMKRMEERYKKQREEDSLLFAAEQRKKFVADSIEQDKRIAQRQLYVQDSIREVNLRTSAKKKRQDSLAAVLAFEKEKQKEQDRLRKQEEARIKDSLHTVELRQKELDKLAKLESDRIKDSIRKAEKAMLEEQKALEKEQRRLAKMRQDSLALASKEAHRNKELAVRIDSIPSQITVQQKKNTSPEPIATPKGDSSSASSAAPIPEKNTKLRMRFQPWDEMEMAAAQPMPAPGQNIDSLRKVDSLKVYFNSFGYRLKKSTEISFYLGVSNYLGDLGGNSGLGKKFFYDNNFKKRNNFLGASVTLSRKEFLGIRISYINGKISASDHDIAFSSKADDAFLRYKRNLDFQTKISEWSLMAEFTPLKLYATDKKAFRFPVQPYALFGIGTFHFNPQGSYYDEIAEDYIFVDLKPLRTEGQGMKEYPDRKPYALRQWNIPFGCGVKYVFGRRTSLGFEFVGRKLFTDYLDDVSTTFIDPSLFDQYLDEENAAVAKQIANKSDEVDPDNAYGSKDIRGNPKYNDFYYSFNLKFSYRLSKLK